MAGHRSHTDGRRVDRPTSVRNPEKQDQRCIAIVFNNCFLAKPQGNDRKLKSLDRMVVLWYGAINPIAGNDNEEGRAKNRQVEIAIGGLK